MTLIGTSKLTVIVGLGVTGLSAARFLQRQHMPFMVMDSRENPPGLDEFKQSFPDVTLRLGQFDSSILNQANEIVLSPGISLKTPEIVNAVSEGADIIGDVELFAREVKRPVVAITGSNAKTTVTSLVGQMAVDAGVNVAIGGNIGKPVLDLLEENADLYVLELSSFQLETTFSLKAKVATVLNISADHMDRYNSLADYHHAKQKIYFGAETVVTNRADPLTQPPLAQGVTALSFGLDKPDRHAFGVMQKDGIDFLAHEFKPLLSAKSLQLRGQHNTANCLAALAIGYAAGLPTDSMLTTLQQFEGLPHRCQWVSSINGVDYINDSKATNVGATLAALDGLSEGSRNIILIAGGDGKGADFSALKQIVEKTVRLIILIGRDAKEIDVVVNDIVDVLYADTLQKAVLLAKENAQPGNIVLLSPACASFDMFSSYEERGNQFIDAVKREAA